MLTSRTFKLVLPVMGLLFLVAACIPPPPPAPPRSAPPTVAVQPAAASPVVPPSPVADQRVSPGGPRPGVDSPGVGSPVAASPAVVAGVSVTAVSPSLALGASPVAGSASPGTVTAGLPNVPHESGSAERGQAAFARAGCIGCHTANTPGGTIGPNLSGVATRAVDRAAQLGLSGPRDYFVQSIVMPQAYIVEGFAPVMLDWKQMRLTEQDLADLAAFLGTLRAP